MHRDHEVRTPLGVERHGGRMHRYHEVRTPLRGFLVSEAQGCNLYSASTSHSELATQRWKLPLPRANGSKSQRPSTDIRCAG